MEKFIVKVNNRETSSTRSFSYNSEKEAEGKAKSFKRDPRNKVLILKVGVR